MAIALPRWWAKMFPDIGNGPLEGKITSSWDLQWCEQIPHLHLWALPGQALASPQYLQGTLDLPQEIGFCSILRTWKSMWHTADVAHRTTQYGLWPQSGHWLDSVFSKCGLETTCIKTIKGGFKSDALASPHTYLLQLWFRSSGFQTLELTWCFI